MNFLGGFLVGGPGSLEGPSVGYGADYWCIKFGGNLKMYPVRLVAVEISR